MNKFDLKDTVNKLLQLFDKTISPYFERNKRAIFWISFWALLLSFAALSVYVMLTKPQFIDIEISEEIQEDQNSLLNRLMVAISWLGRMKISLILISGSTLLFFLLKRKKDAVLMLSTAISGLLAWVLKLVIDRPRPSTDFVAVLEETHFQSFPSGHVLFYTAFFGALLFIFIRTINENPALKIIAIVLCISMVFLCAVSRVYLGAHWFTDVLGGFIAGLFYLLIAGRIYFGKK